jgi:hypothetical protein
MTDEDFEDFEDDEISEDQMKMIKAVTSTTTQINHILKEQTVSVGISALTSAIVQMICLTSDSKEDAEDTGKRFAAFVFHAIGDADNEGICNWNATRQ